jgi:hypothetical protein
MLVVQMIKITPLHMIFIGCAFLILGVVFPLLMVLKLVPTSLWLCFLTYTFSVVGMFVGFIGTLTYARNKRQK